MGDKKRQRRLPLTRSSDRTLRQAFGRRCWRLVPLALVCHVTGAFAAEPDVNNTAPATIARAIAPSDINPDVKQAEYRTLNGTVPAFRDPMNVDHRVMDDPNIILAAYQADPPKTPPVKSAPTKAQATFAARGIPIPKAHSASEKEPVAASVAKEAPVGKSPSRLAPSQVPQVAVHREASATTEQSPIKQVGSFNDEGVAVPADATIDLNAHWPTVIYTSSNVTIFVPSMTDASSSAVSVVALRKTTGTGLGGEVRANVQADKATFRGLDAGVYEVEYLTASSMPVPPRRRIIIELNHEEAAAPIPATATQSTSRKPTQSIVKPVDLLGDGKELADRLKHAEDLLDRGATYTALREFQSMIRDWTVAKNQGQPDVGASLVDFLDNPVATLSAISNGRQTIDGTAKRFAEQVNRRAELAAAFFGLGRTYQLIESEEKPLIAQAASSAEICHLTACRLDATMPGPMREIGARRLAEGQYPEAIRCLEQAIVTAPDADAHFLLGQVYAVQGDVRSAIAAYIEANRLDPRYLPAAYELSRLDLETSTRALYPGDVRDLALRLQDFGTCEFLNADDREWASRELARITWLAREVDMNSASFTARRWIPQDVRWMPGEQSAPKVAEVVAKSPIQSAVTPIADKKLPDVTPANQTPVVRRSMSIEVRRNGTLAPVSVAEMRETGKENARLIPAETPWAGSNHPVITPTSGVAERPEGVPIPRASAAWSSKVPANVDQTTDATARKIPVAQPKHLPERTGMLPSGATSGSNKTQRMADPS